MKKTIKFLLIYILPLLLLASCKKLEQIDYSPKITPETFLQNQHYLKIQIASFHFIWSQPSSTIIVYFIGLFAMFAGYRFLSDTKDIKSKKWWGVGLILTGLGALFAGTSYQALGYEIKSSSKIIFVK